MKRFFSVAIGMLAASVLLSQVLHAQTPGGEGQLKPGDATIYSNIEMNCLDVKLKLSKVYEQDGLHRVNAGQIYDTMSNRLMARLNAKIVSDRLDGGDLIKTAAEFEEALVHFRDEYHTYEIAMNRLLKSDCQSRQHAFYIALRDVREGRKAVHESVQEIDKAAKEYYAAFKVFRDAQLHPDDAQTQKQPEKKDA
ncbi:MAG: hypothetical protein ACTJG2_03105 [Candidatus Saccharimonadales bacterium]